MLLLKTLAVGLTVITLTPTVAIAQRSTLKPGCEPLARITASNDSRLAPRTLICQGDRVPASTKGNVSFFCFAIGKVLSLIGSDNQFRNCKPSSVMVAPCSPDDRSCRRSRTTEDLTNSPRLITPYGSTLISGRPAFSWSSVPGATHYILQVRNATYGWRSNVRSTTAIYPTNQLTLSPGKVYQINVVAYRENKRLSASTKRINILPAEATQQLSSLMQQINHLGLPDDEAAYLDLNAAYSARGLVDEAIRLLEARIAAGSRNASMYRALGDQFMAAGLPKRATLQYEIAYSLAQASDNSVELRKSQAGLDLAALYLQEIKSPWPKN